MSTTTPTIGLVKPDGSDPFLTQDFVDNYDKIDAAFAARPPGSGSGGLTQAQGDARYVRTVNGTPPDGSGNVTVASGGASGGSTVPPDDAQIIKGPGRNNTKVVYGVAGFALNAQNGVVVTVNYPGVYTVPPAVFFMPKVPSNFDLVANVQGLTESSASCRFAQKSGTAITMNGQFSWMTIGQA